MNKPFGEDDDDGRTIADMNIEGMPWYKKDDPLAGTKGQGGGGMSEEEFKAYRWAALKSALLVGFIFAFVFFIFIAFCDFVWFR